MLSWTARWSALLLGATLALLPDQTPRVYTTWHSPHRVYFEAAPESLLREPSAGGDHIAKPAHRNEAAQSSKMCGKCVVYLCFLHSCQCFTSFVDAARVQDEGIREEQREKTPFVLATQQLSLYRAATQQDRKLAIIALASGQQHRLHQTSQEHLGASSFIACGNLATVAASRRSPPLPFARDTIR